MVAVSMRECVGVACVVCVCRCVSVCVSACWGVREGWDSLQAKVQGLYYDGGSSLSAAVLESVVGSSDWSGLLGRLRMYSHDRSNDIPTLCIMFYGLPTKSMAWWQTDSITSTP